MKDSRNFFNIKEFLNPQNYLFYLRFAKIIIPIFLQSLMESLVNLIDNFMVGALSDQQALNGVGMTISIYNAVFFLSLSWSIAGGMYLSQYIGKSDSKSASEIFSWQLILAVSSSFIFMILSLIFPRKMLSLFYHTISEKTGSEKGMIEDGVKFLSLIAWTFPLLSYSMISFNAIYTIGDTMIPFKISFISLLLNIVIDPLLMIGFDLGFIGAAIGTLISRIFEILLITIYFIKVKPIFIINFVSQKIKLSFKRLKKIFIAFIPTFIGEFQFGWAINAQIFIMYRYGGANVLTAIILNFTIMGIFYSIFTACTSSVPFFIGRYLGRNMINTALINARRLIFIFFLVGIFTFILGLISSNFIHFLFPSINSTSLNLSKWFIRIQSFAIIWQILTILFYTILRSGGRVIIVTIVDLLTMWILIVGGSWGAFEFLNRIHLSFPERIPIYVITYLTLMEMIISFIAYLAYKFVRWERPIIAPSH